MSFFKTVGVVEYKNDEYNKIKKNKIRLIKFIMSHSYIFCNWFVGCYGLQFYDFHIINIICEFYGKNSRGGIL